MSSSPTSPLPTHLQRSAVLDGQEMSEMQSAGGEASSGMPVPAIDDARLGLGVPVFDVPTPSITSVESGRLQIPGQPKRSPSPASFTRVNSSGIIMEIGEDGLEHPMKRSPSPGPGRRLSNAGFRTDINPVEEAPIADDQYQFEAPKEEKYFESPELHANWISKRFWHYCNALLYQGWKHTLEMEDLYPLMPQYRAEELNKHFDPNWADELRLLDHPLRSTSLFSNGGSMESTPKLDKKGERVQPSLFHALWRGFGKAFMVCGLYRIIADICNLCSPFVMQTLINFMTAMILGQQGQGMWYGYMLAVILFVLQLLYTFFMNAYFEQGTKVGFSLRSVLISAVYRKSLLLSQSARQDFTAGKTTNLMSTDCSRIDTTTPMVHTLWSSPITILVAMALLITNIGASALVGFALLVILLPFQGWLMKYLMGIRRKVNKITDERVKITQEYVQGIRVIKYTGWESAVLERISNLREQELHYVRTMLNVRAWSAAIMQVQPVFAAMFSFLTFIGTGGTLTPGVVFGSLAYFNVMRLPLMFLPMMITACADAWVSIQRLEALLLAPELEEKTIYPADFQPKDTEDDDWAARIKDGAFIWEPPPKVEAVQPNSKIVRQFSSTMKKPPGKPGMGTMVGAKDPVARHQAGTLNYQMATKPRNQDLGVDGLDLEAIDKPVNHLRNIDLVVPKGSLCMVVGPVGSGKSSLLAALVGEMKRSSGLVQVRGKVAYCAQQSWIQNATVRNNIVFGSEWDEERYWKTIKVCALERDLDLLPDGDWTEVGERGITVSGGQKQRISLARATYSNADVMIMDDILSAVDSHVARHLTEQCINGFLKGKTRILATHQLHILPLSDWVVCVVGGEIVQQGRYEDLLKDTNGYLATMVRDYGAAHQDDDDSASDTAADSEEPLEDVKRKSSLIAERIERQASSKSLGKLSMVEKEAEVKSSQPTKKPAQLMQEEDRATGAVSWDVYVSYFKAAGGWWVIILLILSLALSQVARVGNDLWLGWWSSNTFPLSVHAYMGIYAVFGVLQGIFVVITGYVFAYMGVKSSGNLHNGALTSVFRAPIAFFDTTPVGRIMNRFSKDVDSIDNVLPETMRMFLNTLALTIASLLTICFTLYWFIIPLVIMLPVYFFAQAFYRSTSREVKRLDSVSRSPLYAHFSETLSGLATIRAYTASMRFEEENKSRLDVNNRAYYITILIQRWLSIRLESASAILILCVALFAVASAANNTVPAGILSLCLTYALSTSSVLNWCVRQAAETEMQMNSVERLGYYRTELEQEAPPIIEDNRPIPSWPEMGHIQFENVEMRYRPELPLVLKGVSLDIPPGSRVGIVGRTGAGKSTVMSTLFRMQELSRGRILIDGVDISKIGLDDLRQRLSMIPQEATLFSGTVRSNLDPFNQYQDADLWDVLSRCGGDLKEMIAASTEKLEYVVSENGDNFSVGQRQLLCLARAMLRHSKILLLDEASASVDYATDDFIQQTLRTDARFAGCTIVTIAHRLNTIIDYDLIICMADGQIVESGHPSDLVKMNNGVFRSMIMETGEASANSLIQTATLSRRARAGQTSTQ